jgi:hypothetical protein
MTNHLAEAARYNDARAEDDGVQAAVAALGLDWDELTHVVEQRALRLVLLIHRGDAGLKEWMKSGEPARLTVAERTDMMRLQAATIDGVTIGWAAHQIKGRSEA